jgi:putative chitinase
MITKQQLQKIYKECPEKRVDLFLPFLNDTMAQYEINTPQRIRMFLAQIGHESGRLLYTEEIASGAAYEGRKDLGNTSIGDGVKYKGRGLIQITGKTNYLLCGMDLDLPLLEQPELLSKPLYACESAGWFWKNNNLNSLCDMGLYRKLSYRINGGREPRDPNGWPDRMQLYQRASEVV